MFFNVYFIAALDRASVIKVRHKTHLKKHPSDRDTMPAAGDAFPAAFPWPFTVVASRSERAYRGAGTAPTNPYFERRI